MTGRMCACGSSGRGGQMAMTAVLVVALLNVLTEGSLGAATSTIATSSVSLATASTKNANLSTNAVARGNQNVSATNVSVIGGLNVVDSSMPNGSTLVFGRGASPSSDFFCFQVDQRVETEKWKIYIILLVPIRRYFFGFSQQKVETAVRIAVNQTFEWYKYGQVNIASRDSDCNSIAAPLQAMEIFYRKRVNVFIGPICSVSLAPVARYAGKWNIPVITPGGLATELTKERPVDFPTLTVVSPIQSFEVARFLFQIFERFRWRKYVSVYDRNGPEGIEHGYCSLMNRAIQQEQNQKSYFKSFPDSYSSVTEANDIIEKHAASHYAIIVLCGNLQDIRDILLNALAKGFIREQGGEYVFITIDLHSPPNRLRQPWYRDGDSAEKNERARIAFRANLIISVERTEMQNLTLLMNEVEARYPSQLAEAAKVYDTIKVMLNRTNVTLTSDERAQANNYVAAFYNAIVLFSEALKSMLTDANGSLLAKSDALLREATSGHKLTAAMRNRTVEGITGPMVIDQDGNRQTSYTLRAMNAFAEKYETVARYASIDKVYEPIDGKRIYWPSGVAPPPDTPVCGYDNQGCLPHDNFPEWGIVLIVIGGIFSVLLIVALFVHRKYKVEKQLSSMNWRVRWTELEPLDSHKQPQYGTSSVSLANPTSTNANWIARDRERPGSRLLAIAAPNVSSSRLTHGSIDGSEHLDISNQSYKPTEVVVDGDLTSKPAARTRTTAGELMYADQEFPQMCLYKGMVVWLRRIAKTKLEFDTPRLMELKKLKDVNNNNVCRFIGLCIDSPNQCIVSEFCPRGSLRDILENDHIHLDWLFKFSLIQDIVRGMLYLHQNIGSHGHLTSNNCLVDTRFVLKVTDFGLHSLRFGRREEPLGAKQMAKAIARKRLYCAPELLKMYTQPEEGTREGDVYSFAIVCQEIIYRKGVFYVEKANMTHHEIALKVRFSSKPPFRPTLSSINSDSPEELVQLIKRCWAEDAAQRPDFSNINMHMRRHASREGRNSNILDNLLTRMEQYANNLESLVAARTNDYLEQKKKAEDLLYMMLPRSVALQLIKGEPVAAESYDSVTIYFSDVCGFTALSASSTPMQVVNFLNDLYTTFDSIIESFDVYKVETIGDAYMVVSGLPQPNGLLHAREIGRMALMLLREVRTFKIAHRPSMQLKLRIGMHTGPVCAGVVGLKMPRYCLFGDTVNTASRMESNGAPLRIHISTPTKEVLDNFGTFVTELRGPVEMKGKGKMVTWWLLGERGSSLADTTAQCACDTNANAPDADETFGEKQRDGETGLAARTANGGVASVSSDSDAQSPSSHCPLLSHDSFYSQSLQEGTALLLDKRRKSSNVHEPFASEDECETKIEPGRKTSHAKRDEDSRSNGHIDARKKVGFDVREGDASETLRLL